MGIYSEYLGKRMSFPELMTERKKYLKQISKLRGGRDIIVYASDLTNKTNSPISIDYSDILPWQDQLANLRGTQVDVIIETPGGIAEVVEDMVRLLRDKYEHVGVIIPGTAKSAGTIFSMAADEILMGASSSLGPIDAQIITNNKRYSVDAFLEGLEKIKKEVSVPGVRLNPAYIPILQNISPGEIQHCENAQNFSKVLVTKWLSQYKFKTWGIHTSTGLPVTTEEKEIRAKEIADKLCKHSDWLTHNRSIKINELEGMGLKITNYSKIPDLNDAINRYFTLLKISMESTNMYKIFETDSTQIQRFGVQNVLPNRAALQNAKDVLIDFDCPGCKTKHKIQALLDKDAKVQPVAYPYPKNDIFVCPKCGANSNLSSMRLQIEGQLGKKIIFKP